MNTKFINQFSKLSTDRLAPESMSPTLQQIPLVLSQSQFSHGCGRTSLCSLTLQGTSIPSHVYLSTFYSKASKSAKELTFQRVNLIQWGMRAGK